MYINTRQLENISNNLTKEIIENTIDWELSNWKLFRSFNNYWNIKDNHTIELNKNIRDRYKYLTIDIKFKEWKLKEIKRFNKDNV
jgi:hypothetical protein